MEVKDGPGKRVTTYDSQCLIEPYGCYKLNNIIDLYFFNANDKFSVHLKYPFEYEETQIIKLAYRGKLCGSGDPAICKGTMPSRGEVSVEFDVYHKCNRFR
jgi:hypothetical protein